MPRDDFTTRTLAAIGQDAYLETPVEGASLAEIGWVVSRLTTETIIRLAAFFGDMALRPPLSGPAWYAHREFVEAIVGDLNREAMRRGE